MRKRLISIIVIIFLLILVIIGLVGRIERKNNEYELTEIISTNIKHNNRELIMEKIPDSDVETLITNLYLSYIDGDYERYHLIFPSTPEGIIKNSFKAYGQGRGYKKVELNSIKNLSKEECLDLDETFNGIKLDKIYEDLDIKFVVQVKGSTEYTKITLEGAPQYPDGEFILYYILVEDSNGNLIVYERSDR